MQVPVDVPATEARESCMKVASLYFSSLKTLSLTHAEPPNSAKDPGALRAAVQLAPLCLYGEMRDKQVGMGIRDEMR
jgi:hypothetical protein